MNKGILYGLSAYTVWGFFPILFKTLVGVSPFQIVAHRVLWCFVVVMTIVLLRRELPALLKGVNRRTLGLYALSGLLVSINWLTFVWAVNAGYVLESSLGYFINPLVSVVLGVVFLRERLKPQLWVPVGLATAGVAYLTFSYGALPWVALALAFSFGLYGLVKKLSPLNSLHGLTLETSILLVPAVTYLVIEDLRGVGSFIHAGAATSGFLILAGMITAVPLLLFAAGAQRIPLSIIGLLQYVTPTIHFLTGVFLYHEAFTHDRMIGFSFIWVALAIFTFYSLQERRRSMAAAGG